MALLRPLLALSKIHTKTLHFYFISLLYTSVMLTKTIKKISAFISLYFSQVINLIFPQPIHVEQLERMKPYEFAVRATNP
jgi:hypothetical protein